MAVKSAAGEQMYISGISAIGWGREKNTVVVGIVMVTAQQ